VLTNEGTELFMPDMLNFNTFF